jgi:transposase
VLNFNAGVPAHHPLRATQRQIDGVLRKLSPLLDEVYEERGRPSIPREPLLKAQVVRAL